MSLVPGYRCYQFVMLCEKDFPLLFADCSSQLVTFLGGGESYNPGLDYSLLPTETVAT